MHRSGLAAVLTCALAGALLLAGCGGRRGPQDGAAFLAAGQAHLAKGESATAIIHLKNALLAGPESAAARFLLGQALLENSQAQAAEVELRRALDLKHPQDAVVPVLARALLLQGEGGRLIRQFGATELQTPEAVADFRTSLAVACLQQADQGRAEGHLQAALAAAPDHVRARLVQARLAAQGGRLDEALAVSRQLIESRPSDAGVWLLRGDLLAASQADPQAVIDAYRQAVDRQPHLLAAQVGLLSTLLAQPDRAPVEAALGAMRQAWPRHPQVAYFEAVLAVQTGDLVEARRIADRLLREDPTRPEFARLAGVVALQAGESDRAEWLLGKAVQLAPADATLRHLLAQALLRNARPDQALATLQPVLGDGRNGTHEKAAPATLALAALAHLQIGDAARARALYEAAAERQPQDAGTRATVALGRLGSGEVERGQQELQGLVSADPGGSTDLALIAGLMARRDFAGALRAIDVLERKQPRHWMAPMLRGRVALASGDLAGARQAFEHVLSMAPGHFPAHRALVVLDLKADQGARAQQRLEAVLQHDPRNVEALQALVQLRGRTPQAKAQIEALYTEAIRSDPMRVDTHVRLVQHLIRFHDHRRAAEAAREALVALPGQARLLEALGQAQMAAGDLAQALVSFTSWAAAEPASPQPQMALARVRSAGGDPVGALHNVQRALALRPGHPQALQALIELDLASRQPGAALALARKLQREHAQDAAGFAAEAQVRVKLRQWEEAIVALRAALKREPEREDLVIRLHAALLSAGRAADAQQLAAGWIKAQPGQPGMRQYLGHRALGRQDYAAAEAHLRAVVALDPANAPALNDLAWVTLKLKKPGALALAEKAHALASGRPEILDTLAQAQADAGQFDQALATQRKAVALNPRHPMFRLSLARIYLKAGQKALARQELDQLAALGDALPAREQVLELRKQL